MHANPYCCKVFSFAITALIAITAWADEPLSQEFDPVLLENQALIARLGAESSQERNEAEKLIREKGAELLSLLKEAEKSSDPEIAERAARIYKQIHLNIPEGYPTPLSEFIEAYGQVSDEGKRALLGQFLFREELTLLEARSTLLLYLEEPLQDQEGTTPPEWMVDKYFQLLLSENTRLLDDGKINEAVKLWSDVQISPQIRRKYAAMLYNTGLPLPAHSFSPEMVSLINADLALLNREPEKAASLSEGRDEYLNLCIASAEFDLEKKWAPLVQYQKSPMSWSDKDIFPGWVLASLKNDREKTAEIIDQLQEQLVLLADEFVPADNKDIPDYLIGYRNAFSTLNVCRVLWSIGEVEKAVENITAQVLSTPFTATEASILEYVGSPDFDIRTLGAAEDSLPAIKELANSIMPLSTPSSIPVGGKGDIEGEEIPDEDARISQKLVALALYTEFRSHEPAITPYMVTHIKKTPDMEKGGLISHYMISIANAKYKNTWLLYDFYAGLIDADLLSPEMAKDCENIFFSGISHFYDHQKAWPAIEAFLQSREKEKLSRKELVRKALVLLRLIPGKGSESRDLFEQALIHFSNDKDRETAELIASALLESYYFYRNASHADSLSIPEKFNAPLLPSSPFSQLYLVQYVSDLHCFAPDKVKKTYENYFHQQLEGSRLFTSNPRKIVPAPRDAEDNENAYDIFGPAQAKFGEYLASWKFLDGKKEEAGKIREKSRLYAYSEEYVRASLAPLLLSPKLETNEYLHEISPSFMLPNQIDSFRFFSANYGSACISRLLVDRKNRENHYICESLLHEFIMLPFFPILHPLLLGEIRYTADLSHGFMKWENGKKEEAMRYLLSSRKLAKGTELSPFYWLCLHNIPELRSTFEKWYEEDRRDALEILKKWPEFTTVLCDVIESSLIMNKHLTETQKLIHSIQDSELRKEFTMLSDFYTAVHMGDKEKAKILIHKIMMETNLDRTVHSLDYFLLNAPAKKQASEL